MIPSSVAGVAQVEVLRGAESPPDAAPDLLVEVPHGADRRADYDALRAQLQGELPADLHCFFHFNTDVGAWAYGRATAQRVLEAAPQRAALLVRCLIPRTFVDCNRHPSYEGGNLKQGALTAGIPVYVTDDADRVKLLDLHRQYTAVAEQAYQAVCGGGGLALVPHTYGPRSVGIEGVDAQIVENLRWAWEPERWETWPVRAEVDLLTRDGEGTCYAPAGLEAELLEAFGAAGFQAVANETYDLHPVTMAYQWSQAFPGQLLCLEVRRDLLTPWTPFEEMTAGDEATARVAAVLAPALERALSRRCATTREDA